MKEKNIWLLDRFAHKVWAIAVNITQDAARIGGNTGKGMAVVAEECRKLSGALFNYADALRFDGKKDDDFKGIADAILQINLLAVNACLENLRVRHTESGHQRSMIIMVEELRALSAGLLDLSGQAKPQESYIIPETASPLKSTALYDHFFQYLIDGIPLIENAGNVLNIEYPARTALESGIFNLRGLEVPVIDLYKRLNLKNSGGGHQTVVIIQPDRDKKQSLYAVPIDDIFDIHAIILLKIGYNAPPQEDHVFADYARECWNAVGGGQFMFIDWDKLI